MKNKKLRSLVFSALFLGVGLVLPLLTGQIKEIGDSLLPMHIPVMLCGLICGWEYGFSIGLILPFLRSLIFGMPPIYPNALWMSLELATYGLVIALIYKLFKKKGLLSIYVSLASSMVAGRIVWGITKAILLSGTEKSFTFTAFLVGGFADALPGIIIQLILVPVIMSAYLHTKKRKENEKMINVKFPYGKEEIEYSFNENELAAVLESSINDYKPDIVVMAYSMQMLRDDAYEFQ